MFAFSLCEMLHIPHPDAMGRPPWRMTSAQLADWQAYFMVRSEPEKYKRAQTPQEMRAVLNKAIGAFLGSQRRKSDHRNHRQH